MNDRSPLKPLALAKISSPTDAIAPASINGNAPPNDASFKAIIRLKAGSLELSNLQGDFLERPWIRLSTDLHSKTEIIINDPDDTIRPQIEAAGKIELELGFMFGAKEWKHAVFMGDLIEVGRKLPNATIAIALDPSFSLSNSIGSSVDSGQEPSASTDNKDRVTSSGSIDLLLAPLDAIASNTSTPAEGFTKNHPELKFVNNSSNRLAGGTIRVGQSESSQASSAARMQGDNLIARGNTIRQVAPSSGEDSGVILDYFENRSAFIGRPRFTKPKGQSGGGGGSVTVEGWNATEKRKISATVVSPIKPKAIASNILRLPSGQKLELAAPIFDGSAFKWADVTSNGTRIPDKSVMGEAEKLARAIASIADKGGKKIEVVSWYRDRATNNRIARGGQGLHATGGAVDIKTERMDALYKYLNETWVGGLGLNPGHYLHLDLGDRKRYFY